MDSKLGLKTQSDTDGFLAAPQLWVLDSYIFLQFESNMDEENNLQRSQDRENDSGENCNEGLLNETMELSSTTAIEETIYAGQEEAIMEIKGDANMADEEKNHESNNCLPTSKDSPTSCEQEMSDLLNKSSIITLVLQI